MLTKLKKGSNIEYMNKNITTQAHRQPPDNGVQKSNEVGLSAVIDETKNRAAVRCSALLGDWDSWKNQIISKLQKLQLQLQ